MTNNTPNNSSSNHFIMTVLLIVLVAGSYFLFGLLGLFLAVPPSNAGAVWPPAGIALAASLLLGYRIWPGIYIGNFLISAWAFGFDSDSLVVYAVTGFGATCNALTGRYLINRFTGFPNQLIEEQAIFRFFLLGGPVSCLIPATVGIITMALMGIISIHEVPVNWVSWWVGDTIGVFVFTPLILIFFAKPRNFWKQRINSVAYPLILTFLMVVCLFVYATQLKKNKQKQDFEYTSTLLSQSLNNRIQNHLHTLNSISHFVQEPNNEAYKKALFSHYAEQSMSQFKELQALSWMDSSSLRPGSIIDPSYSKTRTKNQDSLISSVQFYKNHLNKSVQNLNGIETETAIYTDFQNNSLFLYLPVFNTTNSNNQSRQYLGSIVSAINFPRLLSHAFSGLRYGHINFSVYRAADPEAQILYKNHNTEPLSENQCFTNTTAIPLDDQNWKIRFQAKPQYLNSQENWTIWWMLISGLSFTSLLGMGLMLITGRYFKTESIIEERTEELRQEISSKELIEADLKVAKNKAESANEAKSQFLRNMSHELRTPLNGILGFTQLLQNNSKLKPEDLEKVGIIKQCGDYLLTLINDILDISKIEADKIEIESKPFDLIVFFDNMIEIFKLSAEEKHIALTFTKQNLPQTIISDEKHLRQIIMNLLSNAIKFTDQGQVAVTAAYHNTTLQIEVKDTGCGIDEKNHETIFQSFVQISNPNSSAHGTGLGLSITNRLIALMGGKLTLQSQPGIGSAFMLNLPMAEKNQPMSSKVKAHTIVGYQGDARHILLVDDDQANLKFLRTLLQNIGFNVSLVSSGKECLQFCSNVIPDLIFMDMLMPGMSGIKTINALNKLNPKSFKIIGMSASVFTTEKQSFLDAGCFSFLAKPIEQTTLLNSLEQAIKVQWTYKSPINSPDEQENIRVLVADDNEINCLLLNNMLENLNCISTIVNDGKQALDLLETQAFDLALIDLNMPVMDGIELINNIDRNNLLNPSMKILAISAYVDDNTINQTLDAGFDEYMKKPVDAEYLKSYIQSISKP